MRGDFGFSILDFGLEDASTSVCVQYSKAKTNAPDEGAAGQ
jgi:hypothetical protein